jgi:hypothetical protein
MADATTALAADDLRVAQAYQAGYNTGHADALAPPAAASRRQKVLAAGTFAVGLASAGGILLYANKRTQTLALTFAVTGALLAATVGAVSVLLGGPTPKLGLKP